MKRFFCFIPLTVAICLVISNLPENNECPCKERERALKEAQEQQEILDALWSPQIFPQMYHMLSDPPEPSEVEKKSDPPVE